MTGDSLIYKYYNTNTPREKINYSYSKYGGELFLSRYLDSRNNVSTNDNEDSVPILNNNTNIASEILFNKWINDLHKKREFAKNELNLLIKRFEVTKKIFENYDQNFRPTDKSKFFNLRLYVLFSYVLSQSYKKYKNLQYLNALLKVNDINISNIENLDDGTKNILYLSIKYEVTFVQELRNKLRQ